MRILLTGATGMVGRSVLAAALADRDVTQVTALVRRSSGIQKHPKLTLVEMKDFTDYSAVPNLAEHDVCLWCLGISQTKVKSEAEYSEITYDYTVAAAKVIVQVNPAMRFLFLSGLGADQTEKSKTLFARIKGRTENALKKLLGDKLYIIRPGGIAPGPEGNPNGPTMEKLLYPLHPLLRMLMPNYFITAPELAHQMLSVAKHGAPAQIVDNRLMRQAIKAQR